MNRAEDMDLHCRARYGKEIQAAEIRDPGRTTLVCEDAGRLVMVRKLGAGSVSGSTSA